MRLPALIHALAAVTVLLPPFGCGARAVLPTSRAESTQAQNAPRKSPAVSPRAAPAIEVADTTAASVPPVAPTWSALYEQYFGINTEGSCGRSGGCHAAEMTDAASSYAWLQQRGYIAGTQSPLASRVNSCLQWFGGNMPPGGRPDPRAAKDLSAWVAAGAPNN